MRFFFLRLFRKIISLPSDIKNLCLNLIYSALCGNSINIDWRNIRLYNPECIQFLGTFSSGQGLWLHPINKKSKIIIGDNVSISDWTHVASLGEVVISSGCLIGSKVHITDHFHGTTDNLINMRDYPPVERELFMKGPVFIDENVWIGDGAVILPNVRIGRGSVIGANSVVTRNVPPYSVVAGVPAKII